MKSPVVSICIPTYNRPDLLLKALKSCLAQSYKDYEIVITDNSSNEDSKNGIESLNNSSIRYHKNEKNIGGLGNLNKALELSQGKYIKYLMDDDLLKPDCLEKMVPILDKYPDVGVVMSPLEIINENDERTHPVFYLIQKMNYLYKYRKDSGLIDKKIILFDFLARVYPCCVPTGILYRKECFNRLGLLDKNAKFAVDVEICMRFSLEYDFYYLDEVLSSWRFNPKSDTVQLHSAGMDSEVFYYITEKYLNHEKVKLLFEGKNWGKIVRKSYLFASKRSLLSILAGVRSLNFSSIFNTLRIIFHYDKYFVNKIMLPFIALAEIFGGITSWFQKRG